MCQQAKCILLELRSNIQNKDQGFPENYQSHPHGSEVPSPWDDENMKVYIRKPSWRTNFSGRLNCMHLTLWSQEGMLNLRTKASHKVDHNYSQWQGHKFHSGNSWVHIREARTTNENKWLQRTTLQGTHNRMCFLSTSFMLITFLRWAISIQHHSESIQLVFNLSISFQSTAVFYRTSIIMQLTFEKPHQKRKKDKFLD